MFFVLVIAMLSMQWSTAHIHLAEHHDHDGNHHQHHIEAHSHQSFTQNDNYINSTHLTNEHQANKHQVKVVEFDKDCNIHKWNSIDDQSIILTSVNFQLHLIHHLTNYESSEFKHSRRRYIDYSTIQLRAPPEFS